VTRSLCLGLVVCALGCSLGTSLVGGPALDASDRPEVGGADLGPADVADAADAAVEDVVDAAPDVPDVPAFGRTVLPGPSRSSAVAVTSDDALAVAVNRTAGSVSIFRLGAGAAVTATRTTEVATGAGSEPWAVALSPDDNTAFVALRREGQLVRIDDLRGTPAVAATRVAVGAEPTGVALSPSGRTVYVANWGEGTVSVVDAATLAVSDTLDLNATLVRGGYLGVDAAARHGLAHPRALAMTNDGDADDSDETLYVTEFFAQRRNTAGPTGLERFDQSHVGLVYRYTVATRALEASTLGAAADIGFRSTDGAAAGCFPNQLSSVAIASGRVYVTALCESPRGPVGPGAPAAPVDGGAPADAAVGDVPADVAPAADAAGDVPDAGPPPVAPLDPLSQNFRTEHTGAIFVIDNAIGAELPSQRVLLNARFFALYESRRTPDDASRRYPLLPVDLVFQPLVAGSTVGATVAWVVGYGSDALFRVRFNPSGALVEVGNPTVPTLPNYIDLGAATAPARLPYGLAMTANGTSAVVVSEHTRNVGVVTFANQTLGSVVESSAAPTGPAAQANDGRRLFVTGLGRWSLKGQAWNSCEACHPDGLTDNVTWYFGRGPRQSISLDGTSNAAGVPRVMNWTAVFDEVADFELNVRGNSGGVGAVVHRAGDGAAPPRVSNDDRIVFDGNAAVGAQQRTSAPQDGLSGSIDTIATTAGTGTPRSALDDWGLIGRYVAEIRTPRPPAPTAAADVAEGRAVFSQAGCDGCHGGPQWTLSRRFYPPSEANNDRVTGSLITRRWTRPNGAPTSLIGEGGTFRLSPFDAANDQIACAVRNVGTWAAGRGVAPADVDLLEVRANMTTGSQGATGFNPPSLLGAAHGAPYFHAGNARTLEEALGPRFAAHRDLFAPTGMFEGAGGVIRLRQVLAFVASIDERTAMIATPARIGGSSGFDPDVCGQLR
jgi:YVTN family beta-propeller protein